MYDDSYMDAILRLTAFSDISGVSNGSVTLLPCSMSFSAALQLWVVLA